MTPASLKEQRYLKANQATIAIGIISLAAIVSLIATETINDMTAIFLGGGFFLMTLAPQIVVLIMNRKQKASTESQDSEVDEQQPGSTKPKLPRPYKNGQIIYHKDAVQRKMELRTKLLENYNDYAKVGKSGVDAFEADEGDKIITTKIYLNRSYSGHDNYCFSKNGTKLGHLLASFNSYVNTAVYCHVTYLDQRIEIPILENLDQSLFELIKSTGWNEEKNLPFEIEISAY